MIKLLKKMKPKQWGMVGIVIVLLLVQIYLDLLLPDYMKEMTNLIQSSTNAMGDIWLVGGKMLFTTLLSAILMIICGYLTSKIASGFTYNVRKDLFNHVSSLGQEEMLDFSVPSLITRTTNDVVQIQMVIAMGLMTLIKSPVMAVWAVIKILNKSWELSLVTAAFVVVLCIVVTLIVASVLPRFRIVQRLTDRINKVARENLTGINVVHAFNAEDYQNEKFDKENTEMMNVQLKNQHTFAIMNPVLGLGMNGLSLTIFWLGAALLAGIPAIDSASRLNMFSDIVVFSTYATYVVMSFMMLIMIFTMLPAAEVSAERINKVLDKKPNIIQGDFDKETKEVGSVEFKHVTFRYPDASDDDLTDISFKVNKGETLAIIGATGSGKTTLISLIARFYDATSGEVLVDGINVKNYTFDNLYNKLGYMTQKAVMFNGTIKDNVTFGEQKTLLNDEDINKALDLSCASEFVNKLEDKEDYMVAQSGRNLSGGQKQRLSIARALARNSEILIFDDSFSALDYKTDAKLRHQLNEELPDTTKIIVAQRISTIRNADTILVLEDGKICGKGTHDELMKNCSVYQQIAKSQLSEKELA